MAVGLRVVIVLWEEGMFCELVLILVVVGPDLDLVVDELVLGLVVVEVVMMLLVVEFVLRQEVSLSAVVPPWLGPGSYRDCKGKGPGPGCVLGCGAGPGSSSDGWAGAPDTIRVG